VEENGLVQFQCTILTTDWQTE